MGGETPDAGLRKDIDYAIKTLKMHQKKLESATTPKMKKMYEEMIKEDNEDILSKIDKLEKSGHLYASASVDSKLSPEVAPKSNNPKSPGKFKAFLGKAKTSISNLKNKIGSGNGGGGGGRPSNQHLFLFLVILVHVVDAVLLRFGESGANFGMRLIIYIGVFILAEMFLSAGFSSMTFEQFIVSGIAFAIPYIKPLLDSVFGATGSFFILVMSPVWVIYLVFRYPDDFPPKLAMFFKLFWSLLLILMIFSMLGIFGVDVSFDVGPANIWQSIKDFGSGLVDTLSLSTIQKQINKSAIMRSYGGEVEEGSDGQMGVFFEDVNLNIPGTTYQKNQPFSVKATLVAKNFPGALEASNKCVAIKSPRDPEILGEVIPLKVNLYSIPGSDFATGITCQFPNGLPAGYYQIAFRSMFPYNTSADVTYVFVDQKLQQSYFSRGENINERLDIPKKAVPVYTDGPVKILMSDLSLPLGVDTNSSAKNSHLPPFGFVLTTDWIGGTITGINTAMLHVQKDITLDKCTPKPTENITLGDETQYAFKVKLDQNYTFSQIDCRINIPKPETFFGNDLATRKTFRVDTIYSYTIEKKVGVRIA